MKRISSIYYLLFVVGFLLQSCKTKQFVTESKANKLIEISKIIENQDNTNIDFKTIYIKSNVKYKDPNQSYNLTAEIKIEKDTQILISLRFFGITMAKALITPTEVKYYEKSGNSYFEGNYSSLSKWLGTDLNYTKIQNLLLGKTLDNIQESTHAIVLQDHLYKITEKAISKILKTFYFEGSSKNLLKTQEISELQSDRKLIVNYASFQSQESLILPTKIIIEAIAKENLTSITLENTNVTINESLNFPYSVPSGFEKITIE